MLVLVSLGLTPFGRVRPFRKCFQKPVQILPLIRDRTAPQLNSSAARPRGSIPQLIPKELDEVITGKPQNTEISLHYHLLTSREGREMLIAFLCELCFTAETVVVWWWLWGFTTHSAAVRRGHGWVAIFVLFFGNTSEMAEPGRRELILTKPKLTDGSASGPRFQYHVNNC